MSGCVLIIWKFLSGLIVRKTYGVKNENVIEYVNVKMFIGLLHKIILRTKFYRIYYEINRLLKERPRCLICILLRRNLDQGDRNLTDATKTSLSKIGEENIECRIDTSLMMNGH